MKALAALRNWRNFKIDGQSLLPADALNTIASLDPYLVWAEATGFEYLDNFNHEKRMVGVMVELANELDYQQLPRQPVELRDAVDPWEGATRFVCGSAGHEFFAALNGSLKGKVKRVELSGAVRPARRASLDVVPEMLPEMLPELFLGVIDNGCPFAHRGLRANPSRTNDTRIRALWDQGAKDDAGVPFGYGRLHVRDSLNAATARHTYSGRVDEATLYRSLDMHALSGRASHGAHVLDVLAGPVTLRHRTVVVPKQTGEPIEPPTWQLDAGKAAKAPIVFVQIPQSAVQDNSGRWLGRHVLNGLRFILHAANSAKRVIANVSYGPQTGPHDGSSILEQAIDEMIDQQAEKKQPLEVVLPAGNSFGARCHAGFDLAGGARKSLSWRLPPNCEAPSFAEVWLPKGTAASLDVEVAIPGSSSTQVVSVGAAWCLHGQLGVQAIVVYPRQADSGAEGTLILVALAPTFSFKPSTELAPHGVWTLTLHNRGRKPVAGVHAYLARNDLNLGAALRARPSHFEDRDYDPQRHLREAPDDDPSNPCAILRRGTLSGIATGRRTQVVAGYRWRDDKHAPYSSAGPGRGKPPRRPTVAYVSDESTSLPGVRAAGNLSGSVVRLVGTSAAAPQWARQLADPSAGNWPPRHPSRGPAQDPDLFGDLGRKTPSMLTSGSALARKVATPPHRKSSTDRVPDPSSTDSPSPANTPPAPQSRHGSGARR